MTLSQAVNSHSRKTTSVASPDSCQCATSLWLLQGNLVKANWAYSAITRVSDSIRHPCCWPSFPPYGIFSQWRVQTDVRKKNPFIYDMITDERTDECYTTKIFIGKWTDLTQVCLAIYDYEGDEKVQSSIRIVSVSLEKQYPCWGDLSYSRYEFMALKATKDQFRPLYVQNVLQTSGLGEMAQIGMVWVNSLSWV